MFSKVTKGVTKQHWGFIIVDFKQNRHRFESAGYLVSLAEERLDSLIPWRNHELLVEILQYQIESYFITPFLFKSSSKVTGRPRFWKQDAVIIFQYLTVF